MIYWIRSAVLAPVLLAQGSLTRSRTPVLPEPPGDRTGSRGTGRPLRLLIAGDSAAAGVGAAHQDEALLGQLLARLVPSWHVSWRLAARTGATTASTRRELETLRFPALPQPLRWHLGRRAMQLDAALRADIHAQPDCVFLPLAIAGGPEMMARDGFHPGPPVYAAWAKRVADQINERFSLD